MLLDLPDPLLRQVALHCSAAEICSLVSSHRSLDESLARSAKFWLRLLRRDSDDEGSDEGDADHETARRRFLLHSHKSSIRRVEWIPISNYIYNSDNGRWEPISGREGHLCCVLGGPRGTRRVCIQGGFTDDDNAYLLSVGGSRGHWEWRRLPASGVSHVYGATLTALSYRELTGGNLTHDIQSLVPDGFNLTLSDDITIQKICVSRAVRFGGFR